MCIRKILVCKVLFSFFLKVKFLNLYSQPLNQVLLHHFSDNKRHSDFFNGIGSRVLYSSLCSSHFSPISRTVLLLLPLFLLMQKWGQLCLLSWLMMSWAWFALKHFIETFYWTNEQVYLVMKVDEAYA